MTAVVTPELAAPVKESAAGVVRRRDGDVAGSGDPQLSH